MRSRITVKTNISFINGQHLCCSVLNKQLQGMYTVVFDKVGIDGASALYTRRPTDGSCTPTNMHNGYALNGRFYIVLQQMVSYVYHATQL
jgi:hypothetical protein